MPIDGRRLGPQTAGLFLVLQKERRKREHFMIQHEPSSQGPYHGPTPGRPRQTHAESAMQMAPDPTDESEVISMVPYHSAQAFELSLTFDPGLLYREQRLPPGVNVIGIVLEGRELKVFDGPAQEGAPVPNAEMQTHLIQLLQDAEHQYQNLGGLLISRSQRVYAASLATVRSGVARQQIPDEQVSATDALVGTVPNLVHHAVASALRMAQSEHPVNRISASGLCLLSGVGCIAAYYLLHLTSVLPVYEFLTTAPLLSGFASPVQILGIQTSAAAIIAWFPTIIQHIGFFRWRERIWKWATIGVSVLDIAAGLMHWYPIVMHYAWEMEATHTGLVVVIAKTMYAILTLLIASVSSLGWESLGLLCLILTLTMSGSLFWIGGQAVERILLGSVKLGYGFSHLRHTILAEMAHQEWKLGYQTQGTHYPRMGLWSFLSVGLGFCFLLGVIILGVILL